MQDLNITLVQSDLVWEDRSANLKNIGQKIDSLSTETDIIILPEMFSTGFSMLPDKLAEGIDGVAVNWMAEKAKAKNAVVTGSLIIKENDSFYNRLIWMRPDGSFQFYDKKHLFSMTGEEKVYVPGTEKLVVKYKGWKICPLICYDLRFPAWIRNKENYDLLIFVANWPERRRNHWRALLPARAIENQCYVAAVNRVGEDGNSFNYTGNSMAIDPMGEILLEAGQVSGEFCISFKYEEITKVRRYMPFLKDMDDYQIG